jgi:hypothetical protein
MNKVTYDNAVNCAMYYAQAGKNWNTRFLHVLDTLGLELKPMTYKDPLDLDRDIQAPEPFSEDQVWWPPSIIGIKNKSKW